MVTRVVVVDVVDVAKVVWKCRRRVSQIFVAEGCRVRVVLLARGAGWMVCAGVSSLEWEKPLSSGSGKIFCMTFAKPMSSDSKNLWFAKKITPWNQATLCLTILRMFYFQKKLVKLCLDNHYTAHTWGPQFVCVLITHLEF